MLYTVAPGMLEPDCGAIFATNINWNDFGYNFNACLRIKVDGLVSDFSIKILPFIEDSPVNSVDAWIKYRTAVQNKTEKPKAANVIFPGFVSVFSSVKSYRELAAALPRVEYEELLGALKEINYLHHDGEIASDVFEKIIECEQFATAVLRDASAYKSFRFGFYSSNFLEPPEDARIKFLYTAKLNGFDGAHSVDFTYSDIDIMSDRVHCLIGTNGVGKTSYLKSLVQGCLKRVNSLAPNGIATSLYDASGDVVQGGVDEFQGDWQNLPAYSRLNVYSTDPYNALPRKASVQGCFDYRYFDMGLEDEGALTQFLADIIRDEEAIGQSDRFVLLKKIIQKIIPAAQLMIPVKPNLQNASKVIDEKGHHWVPIGAIRGGELRKLEIIGLIDVSRDLSFRIGAALTTPLSSGQKMYLRFATHFLTTASEGMLILIDEPETHLHPNLITEFMNLLYLVLDATRSVAVIATHSAYVVREVPSHCVNVFKLGEENEVSTEKVYLHTLGANVSSISNAVFGDSLVQSFTDRIAKQISESGLSVEQVIDRYRGFLSMDMLVKIREFMRD
ncbi:AAA family ATPase [Pseudomonas sp. RTC3]|uniref:AAA family ATPase n=1 Tax=Pseudomonas sp. 5C2 TaxID=3048588 RepID=UPI002AB3CB39|nr:AAA family ATPase [Pseudomonas sp. 5C2]MDY7566843.1 AAA family ATPase [Pseudomonas sp. 5C2]MEB0061811.1 AAA family ATPase [Pseudomonas sp. RTC3]MEB0239720.1 AAA family ATPase [Pseudomonas sp. 5C2]